ncbi:hypothetical protein SAMN05421759_105119 [Roseivivax lentus]|uniref:Uncharacterized protein n=1 Tax=Roseivivax lentus TaxID=633194 RepID=A0A1N7MRN7_9RHOB|nr:hypothetical protein [Roseivivax lentus]SIS88730.1 hypothetical protein SAMN05421759_105119 [Roseivivax lentus]
MLKTPTRALRIGFLSALALSAGAASAANQASDAVAAYVAELQTELAAQAVVWRTLRMSGSAHAALSEDEIVALDQQWRDQVGMAERPIVSAVLDNDASDALRMMQEASGGRVTEIIVMDAKGLNAAVSAVTSDFWQGDEAKHAETFGKPAGTLHVSEIEFDDSSQTYQMQVSAPLIDPMTDAAIGAVTFGLNAEMF